jgi:hypothetical protein
MKKRPGETIYSTASLVRVSIAATFASTSAGKWHGSGKMGQTVVRKPARFQCAITFRSSDVFARLQRIENLLPAAAGIEDRHVEDQHRIMNSPAPLEDSSRNPTTTPMTGLRTANQNEKSQDLMFFMF